MPDETVVEVVLPDDVYQQLVAVAAALQQPVDEIVAAAVAEYLGGAATDRR